MYIRGFQIDDCIFKGGPIFAKSKYQVAEKVITFILEYSLAMKSATELDTLISCKQYFDLKFSFLLTKCTFCAKINEVKKYIPDFF